MTAAQLPRVFRYNSVELEDPGPEHDPVDVRNLYSATYPEIVSAAIEGPETKDGKRVYTFRKAVGTKGNAPNPIFRPYRHQVHALLAMVAKHPRSTSDDLKKLMYDQYRSKRGSISSLLNTLVNNGLVGREKDDIIQAYRYTTCAKLEDSPEQINSVRIDYAAVSAPNAAPDQNRDKHATLEDCFREFDLISRKLGRQPSVREFQNMSWTKQRVRKFMNWSEFVIRATARQPNLIERSRPKRITHPAVRSPKGIHPGYRFAFVGVAFGIAISTAIFYVAR